MDFFFSVFWAGRRGGLGSGVGAKKKGGVIYAKWEAFSSTFADRRSFMAAALSMMVLGLSN